MNRNKMQRILERNKGKGRYRPYVCEGCLDGPHPSYPPGWSQFGPSEFGDLVRSGLAAWCPRCREEREDGPQVTQKTGTSEEEVERWYAEAKSLMEEVSILQRNVDKLEDLLRERDETIRQQGIIIGALSDCLEWSVQDRNQ